jgi:pyruvate dehydrogenase E1 component alpha subunit
MAEKPAVAQPGEDTLSKDAYLELFRQMVLIRHLEERAAQLYQEDKVGGFLHLYIGEEAVATGVLSARGPEDRVITAYRDHGVALDMGIPPQQIIAELMGKATGISKGKGGSMHLADVSKNYFGGHAVVGAHLPLAVGLALADHYRKLPNVTVCFFGDGATNIGFFHEALNLSKVWDLPVLWVCENNQYGMGTSPQRASAEPEIWRKALAYAMPSERIDGMDVLEVRRTAAQKIEEIRNGSGPQFLEVMTYRYRGHSMGDPERYRTKQEVRKWEERDPIGIYRNHLLEMKVAEEAELDALDKAAEDTIEDAVRFAEASPEPEAQALYEGVYVLDDPYVIWP